MASALIDYSRQNTTFLNINRHLPGKSPSCKIVEESEQSFKSISLYNFASTANNFILVRPWHTLSISLMNIIKRIGFNTEPCGTLLITLATYEKQFLIATVSGICF